MSAYAEQLKHPKWQRRRLEIMQRDGFRCTRCTADDKTLNVHHTEYRKGAAPWEYPDDQLVTLCEDCHKAEHKEPVVVLRRVEYEAIMSGIVILQERSEELENLHYLLVRERDQEWRRTHPAEAAVFDAEKERQLAGLRAIG